MPPTPVKRDSYSDDDDISRAEFERRHADVLVRLTKLEGDLKAGFAELRESTRLLEVVMDERTKARDIEREKFNENVNERLKSSNEFKNELTRREGSFITRSQLDLMLKAIEDKSDLKLQAMRAEIENYSRQLVPLRDRQEFGAGKEAGVDAKEASQRANLAIIAAVALGAFDVFLRLMGH